MIRALDCKSNIRRQTILRIMRHKLTAFAVLAMVLAVPLAVTDWSDGATADQTITIYGYVADVSNEEKNAPLDDVQVSIMADAASNPLSTCMTDGNGMFEFTFQKGSANYISFNIDGYTVRSYPSSTLSRVGEETNLFSFDYTKGEQDADGRYRITDDPVGGSFIGMGITEGHIFGYVYGEDGEGLYGAVVTITSASGRNTYGTTNEDGYFDIKCYYGTYTMSVSCNGFISSDTVTVAVNEAVSPVYLKERSHALFLGLDTPHALEAIGVVTLLTITALLGLAYYRVRTGKSQVEIVNNLEDGNDVDTDDVRHP